MGFEVEVLVVGAGPAGVSAAAAAAERGADVVLVDDQRTAGGGLVALGTALVSTDGSLKPAVELRDTLYELVVNAGVTYISQALVWGLFSGLSVGLVTPGESVEIRPKRLIVATGTVDTPLPFPGWDLPSVLSAREALAYVAQGVPPGRKAVVASLGGLGMPVAMALRGTGLEIAAFAEAESLTDLERSALAAAGIRQMEMTRVVAAVGEDYVRGVVLSGPGGEDAAEADLLVLATGRAPLTELYWIAGCEMRWDADLGEHLPVRSSILETSIPGMFVVGAGGGLCTFRTALAEGRLAGAASATSLGKDGGQDLEQLLEEVAQARASDVIHLARERTASARLEAEAVASVLRRPDAIVCRCEKVTVRQVLRAIEEGVRTPTGVKRFTRVGMGECQGRTCRRLLCGLLARLLEVDVSSMPPLTYRPPVRPLPLGALLKGYGHTG
jgi:thioredoxin reductase/bacterioferritin-associated ferredoxin